MDIKKIIIENAYEFEKDRFIIGLQNIDQIITEINQALQLQQTGVSGRSEQFVCLCPRNETDNCDRKEPCEECETCPHFRQTNCH